MLTDRADGRPYMNVIFGNFYSPAYDDEAFIDETMQLIKELGFNSVMFDTKAWEDFRERYETGALSQYVKMQEYMGRSALAHGLTYNFLLLYLNGDNLYPHIRFSPPIFGEETVHSDGTPGRWYKYWSKRARWSMKEHVERIMEQYGSGCARCLTDHGGQEEAMILGADGGRRITAVSGMDDRERKAAPVSCTDDGKQKAVSVSGMNDGEQKTVLVSGMNHGERKTAPAFGMEARELETAPASGMEVRELETAPASGMEARELETAPASGMEVRELETAPASGMDARKRETAPVSGTQDGVREVIPVCSMWDPVVAPSFDEEGRKRYLDFLSDLYGGDIRKLNAHYGTDADGFSQLDPKDYWYTLKYGPEDFYSEEDVRGRTPKFYLWRDNALWKSAELELYFQEMQTALKEKNPDLFLCPDLSQWGYFLNIYGRMQADADNEFSDLWDTAMRGIDMYALAPYMDSCHFITVPVTPDGYPDAYVVSCQHSMMRVMNDGRPMVGGIYWGRYIYNDLYAFLTPAEMIGTMTACGMDGYTCYGMNGLDDGGVLNRMDPDFLDSLALGNRWCGEVIPLRRGTRRKEIALLFPSEMALFEPFETGNNKTRRLDLLGWYKLCCDLGYQTDVISHSQIEKGCLSDYQVLIIPANDCYAVMEHDAAEEAVTAWVKAGGVLLHGPGDALAASCFGIQGEACEKIPYRYGTTIIPQGEAFCRYHGGTVVSEYTDGGCCVAEYAGERLAKGFHGTVYAFGIQVGASYAAKNIPHVPYGQGNREMYPFIQSRTTLVKDILQRYCRPAGGICERGIETGVFENGMVIVNHRSTPYVLPEQYAMEIYQYPAGRKDGKGILTGHAAVWVSNHT